MVERKMGDTRLMDPRQDLTRANKQLKALSQADRRFVGSHAYQLRKSTVTENGDRYGTIYVDSCKPIPESIPLLVEEIVNNLCSALNQISWRLWLRANPNFNQPICFPIFDTANLFEKAALKFIGGLPQDQQAIFESVQPYNRGNNFLSILRDLNHADNQRLNPVVSTTCIIGQIKLRGMISPSGKFRIIIDRSKPTELEVGAELLRIPLEEIVGEIDVDRNFKYWQVFGSSPEIAGGLPVVSTLSSIRDEVKWVLDQLRPFLKD